MSAVSRLRGLFMKKTEDGRRFTNYAVATKWCNNSFVLCNNIAEIDSSVYDNARFEWVDKDGKETDVSQWYITDCSKWDVDFLSKSFGLLFSYSSMLGCYILCVDHCGTAWSDVPCEILNKDIHDSIVEGFENNRK